MEFNFLTIFSIFIVILAVIKFWYLSEGNLYVTYRLDIVLFTSYIILETYLALRDPSQTSLLLMNIISVWALIMTIKGIKRLKKESAGG
jgi:uncharacterized membrane protein